MLQPWITDIGASWALSADGMGLAMVLLTVVLTPVVLLAEWKLPSDPSGWGPQPFVALVLILEGLSIFVFTSADVLLFYLFFEATLIPMYFLIGGFGGDHRRAAALKFLMFNLVGGFILLASVIGLFAVSAAGGTPSYLLSDLAASWTQVNWETVVERDPQVIVIVDYGERSWQQKRDFLLAYAKMAETPLEHAESLEQLRALENGYRIKVIETDRERKKELLCHLFATRGWHQVLVFARTKHGADALARTLDKAGIKSAAIHGDKSQGARTRALSEFKDGKLVALVATDIAARGIDIDALPYVINYELPNVPEDYVHRIGRTGRAGMEGEAISLVCHDERAQLKDIEKLIKRSLERVVIEGFEQSAVAKPRPEQPPRGARKPQGQGKAQPKTQTPKSGKSTGRPQQHHTGSRHR